MPGYRRAQIVSVMMTVRAAMPPIVIPVSINSWGGMSVRSRPISACHWISQLVPKNEMRAPSKATSPPVKRNMRTACNEGACEEEGLSASVLPTMCCAMSLSFFYECLRDILRLKKRGLPFTPERASENYRTAQKNAIVSVFPFELYDWLIG